MTCNIARDLLPLYYDGLCSDETKKQLDEHIEHCEKCKKLMCSLEIETEWNEGNTDWDKSIAPLKKVKKKIRRKNIFIGICIFLLMLVISFTVALTYGQITKNGISFEMIYEGIRFQQIGREFALGNIEPLYEILDNGYLLQDAESGVLRLVYQDSETYNNDMKKAIMEKYHHYFDGRKLTYKGIEEIGYSEATVMGYRTLYIALKFEGEGQIEYYIILYKTLNGQYWADDYFGMPYLSYASENQSMESVKEREEPYHTDDTLFACLPNNLRDFDLIFMRHAIQTVGQRALEGETTLAENGQLRISIISEQDLADGTDHLCKEVNDKLDRLMSQGYYLTDVTWYVKEYDKERYLYRYQVNLELSSEIKTDQIMVALDCYRYSDKFVYIVGTDEIYGTNLSPEVNQIVNALYE